jgi:hypothetical protein
MRPTETVITFTGKDNRTLILGITREAKDPDTETVEVCIRFGQASDIGGKSLPDELIALLLTTITKILS